MAVQRPPSENIFTSNVTLYNGSPLTEVPAGGDLNDILEGLDAAVTALSPTTTLDSDDITLASNIAGSPLSLSTPSTLTSNLTSILTQINKNYDDITTLIDESLFDANTILAATTDDTPAALTIPEQTLVGRITAGNIDALTVSEIRTLIDVATSDDTNSLIQPIDTSYHLGVGDDTTSDKRILTVLDSATYADNPYLEYVYGAFESGDAGFKVNTKSGNKGLFWINNLTQQPNNLLVKTEGTKSDSASQALVLAYQNNTGIATDLKYWKTENEAIGGHFNISYYNGTSESVKMILTTAGRLSLSSGTGVDKILDEDTLSSDDATALATQQSIKAYVDGAAGFWDRTGVVISPATSGDNLDIDGKIFTDTIASHTGATTIDIGDRISVTDSTGSDVDFDLGTFIVTLGASHATSDVNAIKAKLSTQSGVARRVDNGFAVNAEIDIHDLTDTIDLFAAPYRAKLDLGASTAVNYSCGLLIDHADDDANRAQAIDSFIGIREYEDTTHPTKYLMDVGIGTEAVSTGVKSDTAIIATGCGDTTTNTMVRVRINGTDYWVTATTAAPSTT